MTREKKRREGAEKRKKLHEAVGTGIRKCQLPARVHPERKTEVVQPLKPLELLAPCKAR
jgi:hypothetical protein